MPRLIVRRTFESLATLIVVSFVVFALLQASGNPARLMLPLDATEEQVQALTRSLGLDQPLWTQYFRFIRNAVRGDFGQSFRLREPALVVALRFLPASLQLSLGALVVSTLISVPLGIWASVKKGTASDSLAMLISLLGQSAPVFWVGMLLILVFSVNLRWLPTGGRGSLAHMVLPVITLGWYMNALMTRLVRSSMLEVLEEDYVQTARAKGLSEQAVILKHAFRNAAIPVITMWGLQVGTLMTGAVVTETVFSWPGLGRMMVSAVVGRDFPVVLASVFVFTSTFLAINLLIDISYGWLDPRVRHARKQAVADIGLR